MARSSRVLTQQRRQARRPHPQGLPARRGGYEGLAQGAHRWSRTRSSTRSRSRACAAAAAPASPTGMKWSFVPKDRPGKPQVPRRQRRRVRAGHLQGPAAHGDDPHQLIEGCAICCYAIAAPPPATSTSAASTPRPPRSSSGPSTRPTRRASSARASSARASSSTCTSTAAPAPTSAARRRACSSRWRASAAGRASSRRSRRSSAPSASRRSSTTSRRWPACRTSSTRGADWFKAIGTDERNTGPKLYAISGHVERPGVYEFPMGVTFRELIEERAAACSRAGKLKAVIPGGASAPMLTARPDRHQARLRHGRQGRLDARARRRSS